MNWPEFHHEAMATTFTIVIADHPPDYARQAAEAAFRELDRLEIELSRYVESSDLARANRIVQGETIRIGEDALQCLLIAAEVSLATDRAFDAAYASERAPDQPPDAPLFTLDPDAHTLTSRCPRLHLDLGAVGKGYALDRMAAQIRDWDITSACLESGGSTALALAVPRGHVGWPVSLGGRELLLTNQALSGSGVAVQGAHLINPRTGGPSAHTARTWAMAPTAALSDALSTAFFIMPDEAIAAVCLQHTGIGAARALPAGHIVAYGTLPV